jgi:hypothetical protein
MPEVSAKSAALVVVGGEARNYVVLVPSIYIVYPLDVVLVLYTTLSLEEELLMVEHSLRYYISNLTVVDIGLSFTATLLV